MEFDLWLETEHVGDDIDDFCNALVTLQDGRRFALNVWTYAFFGTALGHGEDLATPELAHLYMLPPDLFVADLTRPTVEAVVHDLLTRGLMPARCQVADAEM